MIEIEGITDLHEIGHGGTATVYRGVQSRFDRTVAIKVLDLTLTRDADRARFERECRAVGSLSGHPNIVTVYDAGMLTNGHPYIVMEHLPRSLADRIGEDGPLPWQEAVAVAVAVGDALASAHDKGVLHRDVKPENVMLSHSGTPKLTDFGLARLAGGFESRTSTVRASLTHASPELVDGADVGAATDIYSLASTVHHLVTGTPPFVRSGDESLVTILGRIVRDAPPDLAPLGVPERVRDVLARAMAKDPAERHPSMRAFVADLAAASGNVPLPPILPRPVAAAAAVPAAVPAGSPRRRRMVVVAGVAMLAALAGGVWAAASGGDPSAAPATLDPTSVPIDTDVDNSSDVTSTSSSSSTSSTSTLVTTTSTADTTTTVAGGPVVVGPPRGTTTTVPRSNPTTTAAPATTTTTTTTAAPPPPPSFVLTGGGPSSIQIQKGVTTDVTLTTNWQNAPLGYVCGRSSLSSGVFLADRYFVTCTAVGGSTSTLRLTGNTVGTATLTIRIYDDRGTLTQADDVPASGSLTVTVTVVE